MGGGGVVVVVQTNYHVNQPGLALGWALIIPHLGPNEVSQLLRGWGQCPKFQTFLWLPLLCVGCGGSLTDSIRSSYPFFGLPGLWQLLSGFRLGC